MTTYTAIPNGDIDQDSPVTQPLMTLLRDNPISIAEGGANAVIAQTGWHPYDMVTVGDGNDGVFYDFAIDGAVASVETPTFEAGYEYLLYLEDFGQAGGAGNIPQIDFYRTTDAAYTNGVLTTATIVSVRDAWAWVEIVMPMVPSAFHYGKAYSIDQAEVVGFTVSEGAVYDATVQTISKVRVRNPGENFNSGKMYLMRRREFVSG